MPSDSARFRKFVKRGNAGDAIADYYKLRPTMVRLYPKEKKAGYLGSAGGFVGDADVQLRIYEHWPQILIYRKDVEAIKIVYKNNI